MPVRHVAAHVRHVDVAVGMLRVRRGLTDQHTTLEAAHIRGRRSLDDHHAPGTHGPPTADHRRKHSNFFSSE